MILPKEFISQMESLLEEDAPAFFEAMQRPPEVSIKINRRKCVSPEETGYADLAPVKWC